MKITYIHHSSFYVELDSIGFLFDYYKGDIPTQTFSKPLIVFVSHSHPDHYSKEIFSVFAKHQQVVFVVAKQLRLPKNKPETLWFAAEQDGRLIRIGANTMENVTVGGRSVFVTTYASTDMGVAFLVKAEGKVIYHAGDLNDWQWCGESEEDNLAMHKRYLGEMKKLRKDHIHVAMVPLDPRLEQYAPLGLNGFFANADAEKVFPMHMWKQFDICQKWLEQWAPTGTEEKFVPISADNQQFVI